MPLLAPEHRVLAVDRPGHGLADRFDYEGVDLAAHATTFLTGILDALGLDAVDVLSNSIGGWWCATFALDQPHRTRRLVIAGHPPGVTRDAPLPLRVIGLPLVGKALGRKLLGNPSREANRKFWGQVLVAHPERLTDEFLDVDVEHMRRNRDSALSLVRCVVGPRGVHSDLLLANRWHELAVPTLFLHGDRDTFMSNKIEAAWQAIAESNPNVRMSRIAGAGHLPWLDEPDHVLAEVSSFLT
jgi:pimeloyl-ACP methyl ester carboxylesterase